MKLTILGSPILLTFLVGGCTLGSPSVGQDLPTDRPTHPTPDPSTCVGGRVWRPTSARVQLTTSFRFSEGSSGYDKRREDLTPEQSAALDGLCLIPAPTQEILDAPSYLLTITDRDGTTASYRAAEDNLHAADEMTTAPQTVDVHTLDPFLSTFRCLTSRQTRGSDATADQGDAGQADAGGHPWSAAVEMSDDTSCLNGVSFPTSCDDDWIKIRISSAARYRLSTLHCFETTRLRLLSADGVTELAAGASTEAPACATVDYHFEAPGTYLLAVEKRNALGCDVNGSARDMFVQLSTVP